MTVGPDPDAAARLPPGFGLTLDHSTLIRADGRTVLGGSPRRLLRLSPAAAKRLRSWMDGGGRPATASERVLARTLTDAGIAHPVPVGGPSPEAVTIVVPVRDRRVQLERCLAALAPGPPVVVVDDGSLDRDGIARAAAAHGARLIRRPLAGGAAAARNAGMDGTSTEVVVFVDSDCVAQPRWLEALLAHFADPAVGAVGARIVPLHRGSQGWLDRYEAVRSPLDMGPFPGRVAPQTRVPYLPAAALAVRRTAARGGFEHMLGEDVDLVWRMDAAGWRVRHEPDAHVAHDHRTTPWRWMSRRFDYGLSSAALAARHPGRLAPAVVSPWSAVFWALLLRGRLTPALSVLAVATVRTGVRLRRISGREEIAVRLVAEGALGSGRLLGEAVTRVWLPPMGVAAVRFRWARRLLLAAWLLPALVEWGRRRPRLDPVRYAATRLLDDLGYCCGVWVGCAQHRTLGPLIPRFRTPR